MNHRSHRPFDHNQRIIAQLSDVQQMLTTANTKEKEDFKKKTIKIREHVTQ